MAKASKEKGRKPLASRMIPRDVETRWNYTYEMLNFAYTYRNAYDEITANRDMSMRDYELSNEEWKIVKDLADVLKVSGCNNSMFVFGLTRLRFSRTRLCSFHVRHQTSQKSSLQWTTLINTLQLLRSTPSIIPQFRPRLQSEKNSSTSIIP